VQDFSCRLSTCNRGHFIWPFSTALQREAQLCGVVVHQSQQQAHLGAPQGKKPGCPLTTARKGYSSCPNCVTCHLQRLVVICSELMQHCQRTRRLGAPPTTQAIHGTGQHSPTAALYDNELRWHRQLRTMQATLSPKLSSAAPGTRRYKNKMRGTCGLTAAAGPVAVATKGAAS
jgi:hypothetical protein